MSRKEDPPPSEIKDASADITNFKPKPTSAFSVGECSSQDELARISFSSFPVVSSALPLVVSISDELLSSRQVSCLSIADENELASGARKSIQHSVENQTDQLFSYLPDGTSIKIARTSISRQGREYQRWAKCEETNDIIRLASGCVPITNDGRVLFCSSSKKKEWILPKGGWEQDENIEETALRETYEEAGVLGTLGERLIDVTFESNKQKKRKLASMRNNEPTTNATNATAGDKPKESSLIRSEESSTKIETNNSKGKGKNRFYIPTTMLADKKPLSNL